MPLRDHFHPPLSDRRKWDGVHGMWPAVIVQQLVELLPQEYEAEPRVHLGSQFEVDIATFDAPSDEPLGLGSSPAEAGGASTAVWIPAEPSVWLTDKLAIPLQLETTYEQTCRTLRIR